MSTLLARKMDLLEARAVEDHAELVGKIIRTHHMVGYDQYSTSRDLGSDAGFLVRLEPTDRSSLSHWNRSTGDNWLDPYWDVTPIAACDQEFLGAYGSFWMFGPSYNPDKKQYDHGEWTLAGEGNRLYRAREVRESDGQVIADFTLTEAEAREFWGDEDFLHHFGPDISVVGERDPYHGLEAEDGTLFSQFLFVEATLDSTDS